MRHILFASKLVRTFCNPWYNRVSHKDACDKVHPSHWPQCLWSLRLSGLLHYLLHSLLQVYRAVFYQDLVESCVVNIDAFISQKNLPECKLSIIPDQGWCPAEYLSRVVIEDTLFNWRMGIFVYVQTLWTPFLSKSHNSKALVPLHHRFFSFSLCELSIDLCVHSNQTKVLLFTNFVPKQGVHSLDSGFLYYRYSLLLQSTVYMVVYCFLTIFWMLLQM